MKIRQDKYGLYIRTNGSVFRPQVSRHSVFVQHPRHKIASTIFAAGQEVKGRYIAGSMFAKVRKLSDSAQVEYWSYHGGYIDTDGKSKSSEQCWDPPE